MKIHAFWSQAVRPSLDNIFLPSIDKTGLELILEEIEDLCPSGRWGSEGWARATYQKFRRITDTLKQSSDIFVYSDVDIQFFGALEDYLLQELGDSDVLFSQDGSDATGEVCTGFIVCRPTRPVIDLFEQALSLDAFDDQKALNQIIRQSDIRWKFLSERIWSYGWLGRSMWHPGIIDFDVPTGILAHHSNFCVGQEEKCALASLVRAKVLSAQSEEKVCSS